MHEKRAHVSSMHSTEALPQAQLEYTKRKCARMGASSLPAVRVEMSGSISVERLDSVDAYQFRRNGLLPPRRFQSGRQPSAMEQRHSTLPLSPGQSIHFPSARPPALWVHRHAPLAAFGSSRVRTCQPPPPSVSWRHGSSEDQHSSGHVALGLRKGRNKCRSACRQVSKTLRLDGWGILPDHPPGTRFCQIRPPPIHVPPVVQTDQGRGAHRGFP